MMGREIISESVKPCDAVVLFIPACSERRRLQHHYMTLWSCASLTYHIHHISQVLNVATGFQCAAPSQVFSAALRFK